MKATETSSICPDSTTDLTPETFSASQGFTLTETLMALLIVTLGLMAVAQMMFVSTAGLTLARSKGSALTVAQEQMEILTNQYRQDPDGANLTLGAHPAIQVAITNPVDNTIIDRFSVSWTVSAVTDARGWTLKSKQIVMTVTPIQTTGTTTNIKRRLNKVLNMSTVLSPRWF